MKHGVVHIMIALDPKEQGVHQWLPLEEGHGGAITIK
jgi:hypothetical protein